MKMFKPFDLTNGPLTGKILIEASAGTGKTFTITRIFLRLLLEKNIPVQKILVVSFTEAATNELKERILKELIEARSVFAGLATKDPFLTVFLKKFTDLEAAKSRLTAAIQNFDEAAIFTIHKFCNRILREQAFESGSPFDAELVTEQRSLLLQIVEDFWRRAFYSESGLFLGYALPRLGSPEKLFRLIEQVVGKPYMRIIPEIEPLDCRAEEAAFAHSFEKVKSAWHFHRSEVISKLKAHKGWNKGVSKKLPAIIKDFDAYGRTNLALDLFNNFEYLTRGNLGTKTNKGYEPPEHPFFDLCQQHWENHENLKTCYGARLIWLRKSLVGYVRAELPKLKEQRNIYFFDDLLINLRDALHDSQYDLAVQVRRQYEAALIDEFQDTDPVQYDIFTKIFDHPGASLFLIGDPKQAVYGFRGADIFAYMKAKEQTKPEMRFTLTTNYRSSAKLVDAVNAVFGKGSNVFLYHDIPFLPAEPAAEADIPQLQIDKDEKPFQLWYLDKDNPIYTGTRLATQDAKKIIEDAVATEIVRLLRLGREKKAGRRVQEKHIAVLVRSNAEARLMQHTLKKRGVNSVLRSTESLFVSAEATDFQRILTAIAEPRRTGLVKAALATEIMGISADELLEFRDNSEKLDSFFERFLQYHNVWQQSGFIRMFKEFLREEQVFAKLLNFPDGERRITNLLHLSEILNKAAMSRKLGMSGLLSWLSEQKSLADKSAEEYQIRLESDDNAVTLMTMHMSKGLQYPIVFCPFTWHGSEVSRKGLLEFHDENNDMMHTIDLSSEKSEQNKIYAGKENLAEKLRLLYVALTRAQNRCYLVLCNLTTAKSSAPAYVFHRPKPFDESNPIESLKNHLQRYSSEQYRNDLVTVMKKAPDVVNFVEIPQPGNEELKREMNLNQKLSCRSFATEIERSMGISSYSSLISKQPYSPEFADYDTLFLSPTRVSSKQEKIPVSEFSDFLNFPRGTKAGTFIHAILQTIDYTTFSSQPDDDWLKMKLQAFGFREEWSDAVTKMIKNVLAVELVVPGNAPFRLSDISGNDRINELEFYFPLQSFSANELSTIFSDATLTERFAGFAEKVRDLTFQPFKGFMKGFIDLVFETNGRFYIVDWKSNYLGNDIKKYGQSSLQEAMIEHFYLLQYHIYTVALHLYLKLRKPDYDYGQHFGGVFYFFLRGIDPIRGSQFGVFYDRPSEQIISRLTAKLVDD